MKTHRQKQRGSVLIIVLWTAALLTVLVTAMAGKVRLSAKTVVHNYDASSQWAELMGTLSKAEAELMLELMPPPVDEQREETEEGELREPHYRFNGRALQLYYPQSEAHVVRIYDHAGKINLTGMRRDRLRQLVEYRLGGEELADPEQVDALVDAWVDWTDLNDLQMVNGAERDYYQSLEQGYVPRNNRELDTVEEILHIRGFAELFEGVNIDAAFTLFGNHSSINLNLATREAMRLLPGMTEEIIENIVAFREIEDISSSEIAEIIPFENLQEMNQWVNATNTTSYYSIFVYPGADEEEMALVEEISGEAFFNPDPVRQAFSEIVEVRGFRNLPRVLKVDPYGKLPDTAPARVLEEDFLF